MASTTVKKSNARTDLVRRARMGPFSLWTALVGAVVGGITFAALLAGAHTALQQNESSIDLSQSWDALGRKGVLVLGGLMFVSYLLAAFVAGRMAWRRGWLNGLAAEIDLRDRIEGEAITATAQAAKAHAATPAPMPAERRNERQNGNGSDLDIDVDGLTKEELYGMAQELDLPGRSQMTKEDLARAVRRELRVSQR
jgi:hypothetical protein